MRLCIHEEDETLLEPGLKGHFKEILHYSFFLGQTASPICVKVWYYAKIAIDSPVTITLVNGESSELVYDFVNSKKRMQILR